MASIRTFVAIELTEEALDALGRLQERLKQARGGGAGRWVRKEGIHLTLKFLGDVAEERVDEVCEAVRRACEGHASFSVTIAGLGCFPHTRRPRVLWAGVEGEVDTLCALQEAVEREMVALGFPKERHPFTPHLTLARIHREARAEDIRALGQMADKASSEQIGGMRVDAVSVMKSDLRPTGAIYTELCCIPLG
ncbi:MAG: RNA 2',3'-cyclic phosphodiesterase [Chloroflexota bacterium]|nr:RNA 2',3'-cyclic phosphodiesterase [Chloroflexota bacterium]